MWTLVLYNFLKYNVLVMDMVDIAAFEAQEGGSGVGFSDWQCPRDVRQGHVAAGEVRHAVFPDNE